MNDKQKFLIIIVIFALLIGGALMLYNRLGPTVDTQQFYVNETPQPTPETEPENTPVPDEDRTAELAYAPDVHIFDRDGNAVHLGQFFSKPTVLNFWASWCGPCQREMPDFNAKYKELGDQVNFVMVNVTDGKRETMETASAFIERNGYEFPVYYDTTAEAAFAYGAYSLPATFFINAEGQVAAWARGAINAQALDEAIGVITE